MESWCRVLSVIKKFGKYSLRTKLNNSRHVCCSRNSSRFSNMGATSRDKTPKSSFLLAQNIVVPYFSSALANQYSSQSFNSQSSSSQLDSSQSLVDKTLSNLTLKYKHLGQLSRTDLGRAVSEMEEQREHLSDEHCYKLLEFAVIIVKGDFRLCTQLLQRIWYLTLNRSNVKLSQKHLELYLEACLLTESPCTLEYITPILEEHGIVADGRMFGFLLNIAGITRETDAASTIVINMKEKDIPATENTFAALLLAHSASGDQAEVESIEEAMKNANISHSSDTLASLMNGYAWAGQVMAMRNVIARAKELGVIIPNLKLSEVILALARSGNAGDNYCNLDWVVKIMSEACGRENIEAELSDLIMKMINLGCVREAFHLLKNLPSLATNQHLYNNAVLYVQEAVRACKDPETVVEVCKDLKEKGITRYGLLMALECALLDKKRRKVSLFIHALKDSGESLREHYFWPLLCSYKNTRKIIEIVKEMIALDVMPELETLNCYVLPKLLRPSTSPDIIYRQLQNMGLPEQIIAISILLALIRQNAFDLAVRFVSKVQVQISLDDLIPTLASSWSNNPRASTKLLGILIKKHIQRQHEIGKPSNGQEDWGGRFVLALLSTRKSIAAHQIHPLFVELKENKIVISNHCVKLLLERCKPAIQEAVQKSAYLIINPSFSHPPLEKEKAKSDGMEVTARMLCNALKAHLFNGDSDSALKTLATLRANHQNFHIDHYKVIDLCTLLVQERRGNEAFKTLQQQFIEEVKSGASKEAKIDPKSLKRNCVNLLMASAETSDYDLTKNLLELLQTRGIVSYDRVILGCLVKCRLMSGDLSGAVEEITNIQRRYNCIPMKVETLIHLINNFENNDRNIEDCRGWELCQNLLNLITEHKGPLEAQHELFFALIEAHKPILAAETFKKLGDGLQKWRITKRIHYLAKMGKENTLVDFLTASSTTPCMDRQYIYSTLLDLYFVKNDADKGLALWIRMQEENAMPTRKFLSKLASLLTKNSRPIPFTFP